MTRCPTCGSTDLDKYSDYIFDHEHEWIDCNGCTCLWIKMLVTSEWIESSSLTAMQYVKDYSLKSAHRKV
jgi:uncharacterized protein (DUF983 family)